MNEEIIADFKQFIASTISQQTSDLRGDMQETRGDIQEMRGDIQELRGDMQEMRGDIQELRSDVKRLDQKIDDLSMSVAEAIEATNEETYKQLQNNDIRIKQLEAKAL